MAAGDADGDDRRRGFLAARLAGEVPAARVFFTDMLIVGTTLNLASAFATLMMLGFKNPAWVAVAVYLAPLPYNVFLVVAVWRATTRMPPVAASAYRSGALLWLVVATLV